MKKLLVILLVLLAGFVLYAAFWTAHGFLDAMRKDKRYQLSLDEMAKQANANLPKQIDADTRMDKEIAGPGNRMTYQYTLLNLSVDDVDTNELTSTLKPKLIKAYKTMPELERFRMRQIEIQYEYRDKVGQPMITIRVSPKDF